MTLATLYTILVCNIPAAIILERQIDDRSVSRAFPVVVDKTNGVYYVIPDHMKEWVQQGLKDAHDANEHFQIEMQQECMFL